MKNNMIRGILVCLATYMVGRLIGGLWAYLNPEKAKKVYTGFTNMIRQLSIGFIKKHEEAGHGFGRSLFDTEIPLEQSEIKDREITAEDKAALEAALAETLRKAENLGKVVSLDDLEV